MKSEISNDSLKPELQKQDFWKLKLRIIWAIILLHWGWHMMPLKDPMKGSALKCFQLASINKACPLSVQLLYKQWNRILTQCLVNMLLTCPKWLYIIHLLLFITRNCTIINVKLKLINAKIHSFYWVDIHLHFCHVQLKFLYKK